MRPATNPRSHGATKIRRAKFSPAFVLLAILPATANYLAAPCICLAQDEDEQRFVVIRAGKIITNAGKEIRDGLVVIDNGKIVNVGRKLEFPLNSTVIDARDRVIMPGLINPRTRYGLSDYNRSGVHGNLSVADEYFPPPGVYDALLDAGYTALALIPGGADVPGRALVVRTAGPEDRRELVSPSYLRISNDKRTFRGALEKAKQEIEKVEKARKEFEKKQAELQKKQEQEKKQEPEKKDESAKKADTQPATQPTTQPAFKPPPIDPAHQALVDLIQKKPDIFALIELGRASDYLHMREVLEKYDIAHHFYARNHSQSDLDYVVEMMGGRKETIILQPLIGHTPYSAERLHLVRAFTAAGCEVSLTPVSDSATEHRRILSRAAELVREGWPRDEAFKSVTLYPARLLGLDARFGTIEKGKDADLIFLDADPFDPAARVREVMIAGEVVHRVEDFD